MDKTEISCINDIFLARCFGVVFERTCVRTFNAVLKNTIDIASMERTKKCLARAYASTRCRTGAGAIDACKFDQTKYSKEKRKKARKSIKMPVYCFRFDITYSNVSWWPCPLPPPLTHSRWTFRRCQY